MMDDVALDCPNDDFADGGDFAGFDGELPDNLSISFDNFFAILDEEAPAAPPPPSATATQSAPQAVFRSFYHDGSSSDQVQMDNVLEMQPGPAEPSEVKGELSGELGSYRLDMPTSVCSVGYKQEMDFGTPCASEEKLSELCMNSYPVKMDSRVYQVSENPDSESMMSCPSFSSTHWLKPSTEEDNSKFINLHEGLFNNVLSSDQDYFDQQLQGNLPKYDVPLNPVVDISLIYSQNSSFQHGMNSSSREENAPIQIIGENLETGTALSAYGSSLILNAESSNMATADLETLTQDENFYSTLCRSSSMFPFEMLPDAFCSKMNTTGANAMHIVTGSNLTSHMESATNIPDNGWMEFFPSPHLQKEEVLVSLKDKAEERMISARSSCASEMDLGTGASFRTLSTYSPDTHFNEILKDTQPVWNHEMDLNFRSESSTDSSPILSSRNSTSGDFDMRKQLWTDSEMNLCSKTENASWESDSDDKKLALGHRKQNRYFKGSNGCLPKYPPTNSIHMNDDADICVLDEISCPAKAPSRFPLIKPHSSLEHSGIGHTYHISSGTTKLKLSDEMLTLRLALEDLSQPRSEASPPEGFLAVPLLRHQRIALSWMVQKETRSLHCSGGILADDQGLGKTVSTIALILMERSPPSDSYPSTANQDKSEALNLDDDDDDSSGLDAKKRARVSNSSVISGSEMKDSSLTVVKSRPAAGTLVVCPTSVLRQWADELQNKVTKKAKLSFLIYHGSNRTKDPDELAKYDVVLTTYAIVSMEVPKQLLDEKDEERMKSDQSGLVGGIASKKRKTCKVNMKNGDKMEATFLESARPLARARWFRVILDEAQSIKNFRTQVARACWGLRAKRRWCLSGTPIQNAIDDLYSYFRFLRFEPFSVYKAFCSIIKTPISRSPAHGYRKLQAVLKTIMLRRTKGTVIDGKPIITLPPKTVTLKKVDFSKEERSFYSTLEAESREKFQVYAAAGTVKQNYVNILLMLLRLRQACGHPLLVKGYDSNSGWNLSLETAKRLPIEKQKDLLSCLEVCSAICTICNDAPEDAVVSICGHVFCNQCICGHLTGDENIICPSSNCKVKINVSSVFSRSMLSSSISDLASEYCGPDVKDAIGNNYSSDSSKIKTALEMLRSLPRYDYPLETSSVKPEDEISVKTDMVGDGSLQSFTDDNLGRYSQSTDDMKVSTKQKYPTRQVSEKAIVFSQWTGMLDLLEVPLKESSIEYRRLDGTMSIAARDKAVKDFNTLPEVTVMIMSLKAASLGLNMVAACHVLLLDLWWNPTTEDQAIDRAHRIGQTRPVTVSRLTVRNTVEDRILSLQEKKREMVASAFGEDESGSRQTRLTVEDLTYLFGF